MSSVKNFPALYVPTKISHISIEKIIELKSLSAESATVELINKFVDRCVIKELSQKGIRHFQLPLDQQTAENRRTEESLPIDKFDWLSFEKVFRAVGLHAESERSYQCERLYLSDNK